MKKVKQLLLIEDDPVSTYLAQVAIEITSIAKEIIICENGKQALDYLRQGIDHKNNQAIYFPELILLDLNMPVMNGYEFLKEFFCIEAFKEKNIQVVVVSSASIDKERSRIEHLPISAYIQKPINEDKLTEVFAFLAAKAQTLN